MSHALGRSTLGQVFPIKGSNKILEALVVNISLVIRAIWERVSFLLMLNANWNNCICLWRLNQFVVSGLFNSNSIAIIVLRAPLVAR